MNQPISQPDAASLFLKVRPATGDRRDRPSSFMALLKTIKEDLRTNDRSVFRPGFQAIATHRFGVWAHGLGNPVFRAVFSALYNCLNVFVRNVYGIELCVTTKIGRRVHIAHQSGITIHPLATLGNDCLLRQGVTLGQAMYAPNQPAQPAPTLGERVWIGANATIFGGVTIGDDVVIGPNSVVMTDVPSGSIVTAMPSRVMPRPPSKI